MPRYGFNFQWMFSKDKPDAVPSPPDLKALDFLAEHGFDFVRVTTDYRFWTKDADYFHPDENVIKIIDSYLSACADRNIQMSLNIHRAPGYCINRNDLETHDLWSDSIAQDAFVFLWETFAKRYKTYSNANLNFDLLNEPPSEGWASTPKFTRAGHEQLMRRTVSAIRAIDPKREISIDGLGGGNIAMPELADVKVIQSCRGYQPMELTHYEASWTKPWLDNLPVPTWPLKTKTKLWNKDTLREFYAPWRELETKGVFVHVGEFGCYNKTPNVAALAWFADLLSLFKEFKWGYALWGFNDAFGIANHGRPDIKYEKYKGYNVDRKLFELYLNNRVVSRRKR